MKVWKASLAIVATALAAPSSAGEQTEAIPRLYATAPDCDATDRSLAIDRTGTRDHVLGCVVFRKWRIAGTVLVVQPAAFAGEKITAVGFQEVRRAVIRDQSARLRTERSLDEAVEGHPPAHLTPPKSFAVTSRTPLGIVANEPGFVGFADFVPQPPVLFGSVPVVMSPLVQIETLVHRADHIIKLTLVARVDGPVELAQAYRIAFQWALVATGRASEITW